MIKMIKLIRNVLLTGLIVFLVSSCDLTKKYEEEEAGKIDKYLNEHPDLDFTLKQSGLYYLDITVGTGEQPVAGDSAFVYYTGYFLDGIEFDGNTDDDEPYGFPVGVGYVIPGFDEGIMLMHEGGTAKLLVPSYLGYGNSGYYMPSYTPLLFDVELDSIVFGSGR